MTYNPYEKAPSTRDAAIIYSVDDVDREYRRLASLKIDAGSPPTDKPWGVRLFIVNDPDGNTVSFFRKLD